VLPKAGASVDATSLKAFLKERIADYKIPKTWSILPAFPFLPNGKIDKRALQASLNQTTGAT
jgi:non-ribosomal peptide synthetase component E (peptide arylation enzyme)